jgi:hypothetical protein
MNAPLYIPVVYVYTLLEHALEAPPTSYGKKHEGCQSLSGPILGMSLTQGMPNFFISTANWNK